MLPTHSPDHPSQRKPKIPNFSLNSLQSQFSSNPKWFWIFTIFILIQFLVISFSRNSPICFPDRASVASAAPAVEAEAESKSVAVKPENAPTVAAPEECPAGRVYVYDLPPEFNKNLLLYNCSDLNPWNWQCGIATNYGFGGPATEVRRVLPQNLAKSWYRTNQFTLEVIFHHRILNHKCRTQSPESAAAFYIPFYAGLAVGKHLWNNDTSLRDRACTAMLRWVTAQTPWLKSNGSSHFTAIGRITWDFRRLTDPGQIWGSTFLNMPEMEKVTRFIIEKAPYDDHDVGAPYPTGFHPKDLSGLTQWQDYVRAHMRRSLYTFIGATRGWVSNDFRAVLLNHCRNSSGGSCRVVDCSQEQCSTDSSVVLEAFLNSNFCLQPRGDSFTRRSVFDCMLAGSVPVFFWKRTAYDQYDWFLPGEPESYSIFINHEDVRAGKCTVTEVLMKYSEEEIRKKREKIIETIPRIIYGLATGGEKGYKDAFDIAVEGVLDRIKEEKEWTNFL